MNKYPGLWAIFYLVMSLSMVMFSACTRNGGYERKIPDANVLLQLLHQQDNGVVQVTLKQCKVANIFAGQTGTGPKYDIYRCQVTIDRYDTELNQSFTKSRDVDLRLSESETGWSLFTDS